MIRRKIKSPRCIGSLESGKIGFAQGRRHALVCSFLLVTSKQGPGEENATQVNFDIHAHSSRNAAEGSTRMT